MKLQPSETKTSRVKIQVNGMPGPQGSKRHVGNGRMIESSKKVAPWREAVKEAALQATGGVALRLDGPLAVAMRFRLPRPKKPKAPRPDRMPDLSKLVRSTEDALTDAGIWADDARVVELRTSKHYVEPGEPCGADVIIQRLFP